jgi:hypothetical protein
MAMTTGNASRRRSQASLSELSAVLLGKRRPSPSTLAKLRVTVSRLERAGEEEAQQTMNVLDEARRHCEPEVLRRYTSPITQNDLGYASAPCWAAVAER